MKTIAQFISCACAFALAVVLAGCASGGASASGSAAASNQPSSSASTSVQASSAGSGAQTSSGASSAASTAATLEDGTYSAIFDTDSSMFHVNEAYDDRGVLTVKNGEMTIHVSLVSDNIVNVYAGTAAEAEADAAGVIQPTTDKVTYSDGIEEEVYGFDIPVPAIDEEFDVAILGKKGAWYDHKVSVSDPVAEVTE